MSATTSTGRILAISHNEFREMFRRCAPPPGWSHTIGVANSGGPDSTCLLFLINRYLSEGILPSAGNTPKKVVSLTIDHDLQASSAAMAEHCSNLSRLLGVDHVTRKIPWSEVPYPPRPPSEGSFEKIARAARYHALFQSMTQVEATVLAFGHHADDQVETSLMRIGRGSKEMGAGGMRACRRWGMGAGEEGSLDWAGYEGMKRWIVRPLLDVTKDRILATCEANKLEYVTDATNFQPSVTLRNALRYTISNGGKMSQTGDEQLPPDISEKLAAIDKATSSVKYVDISLRSGPEALRSAVSQLTAYVGDIDKQVDSDLKRCTLPSPPGTYMVSLAGLSRVHGEVARNALILRIMRYVSFHPWGSLRAEVNRRKGSIDQITQKLWDPDPIKHKIRMFVAGGGVLWTPVIAKGGRIRTPDRIFEGHVAETGKYAWLASRQPPIALRKVKEQGLDISVHVDLTSKLAEAMRGWKAGGPSTLEVLYDCRFLISLDLKKMPEELASRIISSDTQERIKIYPHTRWWWPKVVREWFSLQHVLHSDIAGDSRLFPLYNADGGGGHRDVWMLKTKPVTSEWISIKWIRSLDAL